MAAASGDAIAAVIMSPDAIAVGTDAGDQLAKPGRRGEFCNNTARPEGRLAVAPRAHDAVAMSLDAGK